MKRKRSASTLPARSLLCCALATSLFATMPAMAQTSTAILRGHAQAGAEVVVTNTATGSVRRTPAGANGNYTVIGLPPGSYTVEANGIKRNVTLQVASSSTVDLDASTAAAPGGDATTLSTVNVTAPPSMKDVKTSEVGNVVSLHQIQQLPQATRNFLEFADTVPGMVFQIDGNGNTKLRGGASNASASNLYIDGVGQKSYVKGGGIAGQSDTQGNPFPQLAIGEYKVITSNYKAEYGQISGAAITAATKSGTNEFHGEAFYRYTDQDLRDKRPDEQKNGKIDSQTKEYGFALGGPIIQDRMHFFVAYEGKDNIAPKSIQADANAGSYTGFLPSNLSSQYGAANMPFSEDLYFGKIDFEPTDRDRIELSGQYRDETQVANVGGTSATDHGTNKINKDKRASLRWQHSADNWFNELIVGTENSENNPTPMSIGNGIAYKYLNYNDPNIGEYTFLETGSAGGLNVQRKSQKGWSLQNDLTFTSFQWHGEHTIKMGVSYKDIKLTSQDAAALNPQFSYSVDANGIASIPYRVDFVAPYATPGQKATVESPSKQYGIYIQDDWAATDKLMINVGVRWDYEKNPAYTDFVTSQDFVNALYSDDPANPGQPWANRLLPSGINVADYISTGHNRKNFKDGWAPRLGFSYDFFGDERAVLHGGAGRSYDRNLFEQLALETSKAALSPVVVYFKDPTASACYKADRACADWDPRYLQGVDQLNTIPEVSGSAELFMFNNKIKTPYSDQYSIGISNQVGDWLTDVTFQRILSYDGFAMSLINRYPDGSYFDATGSAPWGEPVPGYQNTILGSNGLEQRSSQVLLSAEKPYTKESGWGLTLSYTHTSARQNRNIDEPYGFDKATIHDYPFVKSDAAASHRFVASGSIDGPWGITFGAKVVLATPEPVNTIACFGHTDADGATCQQIGFVPPGSGKFLVGGKIWGYRTVDFQATKDFTVYNDFKLSARINLLNAFNFKNYSSYIYGGPDESGNYFGTGGRLDTSYVGLNTTGDINYVPRTVTFEIGAKF
ncbi:TonB-dependent receptor [Xanthomonas translucens]|uniref:TonB-dependent receptor n=1 Tax=Xanthomonas campestris pv. translucens TaxID=343 RepID=UPI0002A7BA23|nr:TonB-dependent receptor [Xanthomonas translucens]ELQ07232.1 TonB-dependent outer membrane receptor oar-like protein [Xanthomonas translucens DAR61454]MBC3971255.1 TonB-dependent receptor [Xanthomonas translucens pv. undulosa]MCT8280622.1 TonB-dependent receptor [Xanthomonas translucens pv. undulosa]MCT8315434.1 TonB-dependent receptor [Xanthomonas translucens pv. undulosa]QSQ56169.1 TonB-dependent receptor [Xanthomonas translucens pv. undulosa]